MDKKNNFLSTSRIAAHLLPPELRERLISFWDSAGPKLPSLAAISNTALAGWRTHVLDTIRNKSGLLVGAARIRLGLQSYTEQTENGFSLMVYKRLID